MMERESERAMKKSKYTARQLLIKVHLFDRISGVVYQSRIQICCLLTKQTLDFIVGNAVRRT